MNMKYLFLLSALLFSNIAKADVTVTNMTSHPMTIIMTDIHQKVGQIDLSDGKKHKFSTADLEFVTLFQFNTYLGKFTANRNDLRHPFIHVIRKGHNTPDGWVNTACAIDARDDDK
jgi:hypothetical protein